MEDWKLIGQVSGAVVAYAILTKVFEFIRDIRRPEANTTQCKELLNEMHKVQNRILRILTRIEDRFFRSDSDN